MDRETLVMALEGSKIQLRRIEARMAAIREQIEISVSDTPKKRHISAAGRRRIGEAARKRWAKYRKQKDGRRR